jgi:hypothetical protein
MTISSNRMNFEHVSAPSTRERARAKPIDRVSSGRYATLTDERLAFVERMMRLCPKRRSLEYIVDRLEDDENSPAHF